MNVVLLSADLAVLSRVEGAAMQAGATFRAAASVPIAIDHVAVGSASLVIIDLTLPTVDIESTVASIKAAAAAAPRIVAFAPHVHVDRLDAARMAGCDEVLSRGNFFRQLSTLFTN